MTYWAGYRIGFTRAMQLQKGTFVASLDTLEKLRSGDIPGATRRMENHCFATAEMLYSDQNFRDDFIIRSFAPELIQYRSTYRTNRNDWSVMEEKLEGNLAGFKNPLTNNVNKLVR